MREVGSNVLAEQPHLGRSLPPSQQCPAAPELGLDPSLQQLSPAFFCIIRRPEKPRKTPAKGGL